MRAIKFRAWDAMSNKMWFPIAVRSDGKNRAMIEAFGSYSTDHQGDILMQFTGMKDRKGAEIYEGDIIEHYDFFGKAIGKYNVEYKLHGFNYYEDGKPETALYYPQDMVEVIGNIYQP